MADVRKNPVETALDLFVYAPLGLALTAKDELPQLVEKGRQRVGAQMMLARMIGQFAVTQGQKEAEKAVEALVEQAGGLAGRLAGIPGVPGPTGGAASAPVAAGAPAPSAPATPPATANGSGRNGRSAAHAPAEHGAGHSASLTSTTAVAPASAKAPGAGTGAKTGTVPEESDLAIPGYDSLSASQVVQRLAGLSDTELDAVRRYETANRGRRTILSKIDQLGTDRR